MPLNSKRPGFKGDPPKSMKRGVLFRIDVVEACSAEGNPWDSRPSHQDVEAASASLPRGESWPENQICQGKSARRTGNFNSLTLARFINTGTMNETDTFSGRRLDFSSRKSRHHHWGWVRVLARRSPSFSSQEGLGSALIGRSESVREMARSLGEPHAQHFILDVTDFPRIRSTVDEIVTKFGKIDILVNNAGIAFRESAEETSEDKWDLTMAVNLKAVFLLSQAAGRYFLDQGHGKIINIASGGGRRSNKSSCLLHKQVWIPRAHASLGAGVGTAGRAGQRCVADRCPHRNGPRGVGWSARRCNEKEIPLRRFAMPEEVAAAAVFLASDGADMITGANLIVDGGYTIH